jgi:hypothetical protein
VDHSTSDAYRRFAEFEAAGVSATYYEWASGVAEDGEILALIGDLPRMKRQANLVFAAARFLGAPLGGYGPFRTWLLTHWDEVAPVIMARATQTNEAARCAVLLPVLSRLGGPLALIEAGASAGLCLYPDRYSYRYDVDGSVAALDPPDHPSTVVIPCSIDAPSLPTRLPEVVWRAGVDLNPISVQDRGQVRWLEALVWPEHEARRDRLREAAAIAAREPATMVRGDLQTEIPRLIDQAPAGAQVVVFHSAVLVYREAEQRAEFAALMASRPDVTWLSNEGRGVLPAVAAQVTAPADGRMILSVNGTAVALTGPHGQSYTALEQPRAHRARSEGARRAVGRTQRLAGQAPAE